MTLNEEDQARAAAQDRLAALMKREVSFMREVLSSMQREQMALMENNTEAVSLILQERESLMANVEKVRQDRLNAVQSLALHLKAQGEVRSSEITLTALLENFGVDSCEILALRDQLLALLEKMNEQNARNNHLIQNRIFFSRELFQRLTPRDPNQTYNDGGELRGTQKTRTITLINQEV